MAKEGSTIGGLMDTIGTLTSMALQYGVPLDALVNKFSHMRFEPSGWTDNPDIPNAKSVVDYIFRWLGIAFLPGYREANTPNREKADSGEDDSADTETETADSTAESVVKTLTRMIEAGSNGNGNGNGNVSALAESFMFHLQSSSTPDSPHIRSVQFASFQADAPACDNCGAITVRNGNCYLCHNCGNSMGCS